LNELVGPALSATRAVAAPSYELERAAACASPPAAEAYPGIDEGSWRLL